MKKNLFSKNYIYIVSKQKCFESNILSKTVSFNYLINNQIRKRLGFLTNFLLGSNAKSSNVRSQCYLT